MAFDLEESMIRDELIGDVSNREGMTCASCSFFCASPFDPLNEKIMCARFCTIVEETDFCDEWTPIKREADQLMMCAFTQLPRTEASSSAASAANDPQASQQEPNDA